MTISWFRICKPIVLILMLTTSLACPSPQKTKTTSQTTDASCDLLQTSTSLRAFHLTEELSYFLEEAQSRVSDLVPSPIQTHLVSDSYIDRGGARHVNFTFSLGGIPLCQFGARVHSMVDTTFVEGKLPRELVSTDIPPAYTSDKNEIPRILDTLDLQGTASNIVQKDCLIANENNELEAGVEIEFQVNERPYYGLVTADNVIRAEARFFDVATETAQAYVKSPTASTTVKLQTFTLTGMSDGGSLCSARFQTVIPTTARRAFASDGAFNFSTTDQRFKETAIFVNANRHADWFMGLGVLTQWPGPKVDLYMDGTNNFVNNTAVFLPKSGSTPPQIRLGTGDGIILQNLFIDNDAVFHELGHHIVYQQLTSTSGESLVLHEGLADFFVFAQTGDPCLGRLLCPKGGTLCYSAQCLRTGEFPLAFGDSNVPTEPHKLSQVISSMLWDLAAGNSDRGVTAIGTETIAKDVLKGVDFFPSDAGYTDLILAIMRADKALNSSANCTMIETAAKARGLTDALASANVSCATVP